MDNSQFLTTPEAYMALFSVTREKGDLCPVCGYAVDKRNHWVRFHVSYKPQLVILACRYCNFTEYVLRNNIAVDGIFFMSPARTYSVLSLMKKFDRLKTT